MVQHAGFLGNMGESRWLETTIFTSACSGTSRPFTGGGMSVLLLLHRLKLKTCRAEERAQGSPMLVYTGRSGSSPKC